MTTGTGNQNKNFDTTRNTNEKPEEFPFTPSDHFFSMGGGKGMFPAEIQEQLLRSRQLNMRSDTIDAVNKPSNTESNFKTGDQAKTGASVGTGSGFSIGGLGKLLGSMAPALGANFGGMLGGSSTLGSILGSLGGLAGGTMLGIATGAITQGVAHSGFSVLGMSIGGAASLGILAGVSAALMIGAYFLGKDKQRKADEKTRNQAMLDSLGGLDEILRQVTRDEIDGVSAITQANGIRKQYMDQMSKLKDSKTRGIALKDVSRLDSKITQIKQAADSQSARKALDAKLVPTFADGGLVGAGSGGAGYKVLGSDGNSLHPFTGRVPGAYDRRDDFLARLTGNEVVLTPDVWMPIAPYLKHKRVPGFAEGGIVSSGNTLSSGCFEYNQNQSNQQVIIEELIINLNNQFGAETAAKIIDVAVKTPQGSQAIVRSIRSHVGEQGLGDGLVRDINKVNDRGF